jgi:hypothetical protein
VEEQARWDFAGLDVFGSGQLPLPAAMMLMQTVHGDGFSLDTWNSFISSRGDRKTAGVSFDEIRLWLCDLPGAEGSGSKEIGAAKDKLEKTMTQDAEESFKKHKAAVVIYFGLNPYDKCCEITLKENDEPLCKQTLVVMLTINAIKLHQSMEYGDQAIKSASYYTIAGCR